MATTAVTRATHILNQRTAEPPVVFGEVFHDAAPSGTRAACCSQCQTRVDDTDCQPTPMLIVG